MAQDTHREIYPVEIAGVKRDLPLFEVAPGVRIAVINILGDTELIQAVADNLSARLSGLDANLIVTAEAKSIPLVYAIAVRMNLNWVVFRKRYKPYMGDALKSETLSITTGEPQSLYLDEKDSKAFAGKRIILLDDVISTGSTLNSMRELVTEAGGIIAAEAAIMTEGDAEKWENIIALGHLPVFIE